nr:MAG TPA: hypothetical protein [Caudoviricetes sp.]
MISLNFIIFHYKTCYYGKGKLKDETSFPQKAHVRDWRVLFVCKKNIKTLDNT